MEGKGEEGGRRREGEEREGEEEVREGEEGRREKGGGGRGKGGGSGRGGENGGGRVGGGGGGRGGENAGEGGEGRGGEGGASEIPQHCFPAAELSHVRGLVPSLGEAKAWAAGRNFKREAGCLEYWGAPGGAGRELCLWRQVLKPVSPGGEWQGGWGPVVSRRAVSRVRPPSDAGGPGWWEACGRASPVSQRRRKPGLFTGMLLPSFNTGGGGEGREKSTRAKEGLCSPGTRLLGCWPPNPIYHSKDTRGQMPAQGQAARPLEGPRGLPQGAARLWPTGRGSGHNPAAFSSGPGRPALRSHRGLPTAVACSPCPPLTFCPDPSGEVLQLPEGPRLSCLYEFTQLFAVWPTPPQIGPGPGTPGWDRGGQSLQGVRQQLTRREGAGSWVGVGVIPKSRPRAGDREFQAEGVRQG